MRRSRRGYGEYRKSVGSRSVGWLVVVALAACTRDHPRHDASPSAPPDTPPKIESSVAPPLPTVNLLLHTDAQITLSSRVDNPRDYPEHLVDGKPSTAWNGKTGDLNAWIEVKLDPRVHVTAFEITAGFDTGDLFEKNHRISKLRVEHDGALVQDLALDPTERHPQRFSLDRPGGTIKLTVLETRPGTNRAWKEVVVSELKVLGTAPPEVFRAVSKLPKMSVAPGSAPPPLPPSLDDVRFESREGASLEAVCAAWKSDVLAIVKREQAAGHGLEGYDANEVRCGATSAPTLEEGTLPLGWRVLSAAELRYFDGVALRDDLYLVLTRPDGALVAGPLYSTSNDIGDSPQPGFWRAAMGTSRGQPVLLLSYAAAWHSPYDSRDADGLDVEHAGRVCRFDVKRFTCDQPRPIVFQIDKLDGVRGAAFKAAPRAKLPVLDATGSLRPWQGK